MPIVFEQPQAQDSSISEAYGALEQQNKNRDFQLHANIASAAASNQSRAAALAERAQGQKEYEFDASRAPSARDQFAADVADSQARQRFDQQMALQNNQLTAAEGIRMQRLQQAQTSIQEMVDSGQLTPEEAQAHLIQVQTQINPLQQKQARAHQQLQNETIRAQLDEHARRTALLSMTPEAYAQGTRQVPVRADSNDPNSRIIGNLVISPSGQEHYVPGGREDHAGEDRPQDLMRIQHDAEAAMIKERENGLGQPNRPSWHTNPQEYQAELSRRYQQTVEMTQSRPMTDQNRNRWKPWQQTAMQGFDQQRDAIVGGSGSGMSGGVATARLQALDQARRLYMQYGTVQLMTTAVRSDYERLRGIANGSLNPQGVPRFNGTEEERKRQEERERLRRRVEQGINEPELFRVMS